MTVTDPLNVDPPQVIPWWEIVISTALADLKIGNKKLWNPLRHNITTIKTNKKQCKIIQKKQQKTIETNRNNQKHWKNIKKQQKTIKKLWNPLKNNIKTYKN